MILMKKFIEIIKKEIVSNDDPVLKELEEYMHDVNYNIVIEKGYVDEEIISSR